MEAFEAMKTRRSVRNFKPTPVPEHVIDAIIDAGLYAASARNQQSTLIINVADKDLQAAIREKNREIGGWEKGFDPFYGAPNMLIVLADRSNRNCVYDGSLVMGNLMLAAHALGIGSCWIHRAKEEFDSDFGKKILKALDIEGDWEGIGHCALGYAAEEPETPKRKPNRVFTA